MQCLSKKHKEETKWILRKKFIWYFVIQERDGSFEIQEIETFWRRKAYKEIKNKLDLSIGENIHHAFRKYEYYFKERKTK